MQKLKNSLSWRLTIWFLLLSLLPIAVMAIFARRTVAETFTSLVVNNTRQQARLLAATAAMLPDSNAWQTLVEESSHEHYQAVVVDEDGKYVAHPDKNKITGSISNDFSPETLNQLSTGDEGTISEEKFNHVIGYAPITGTGLTVLVITDESVISTILSNMEGTALRQLAISLVIISIVGGVAIWVVLGPVQQLAEAAREVGHGNLDVEIDPAEMEGELKSLAEAFNQMTAQLRGSIGSLEDQVRDRTAELALSMEVGQRAAAIRNLDELLPTITEYIRAQFNLYYTQVYFVDDLGQNLILRAGTGSVGQELIARRHQLPIGLGSIVGRVAAEGKSIVVTDTHNSDIHKANPLLPETRSELAIPLVVEDRVIGVLDMQADKVNTFTENSLTVFEAMATQLAVSIDSAQQWARAQEAQQKAEEALRQLTHQSWVERLALRRESLAFAYDLAEVAPVSAVDPAEANGGKKVAALLVVQNEPIGELVVNAPPQRGLSADAQALVAAVAQQLAQKAENLRLFEQTQQRAAREQLARQISDKVRASRDIESALKTAAEELSKALGTARAVVDLKVEFDKEDKL
jgi:GAF domain-containing protein/HAMP domain-containing protein